VSEKGKTPPTSRVGYGNPPAERRFKDGTSGNPRGRAILLENASMTDIVEQEIDAKDASGKRLTREHRLNLMAVARPAANGDLKAAKMYFDQRERKALEEGCRQAARAAPQ
jgi:hypothetical protein